MWTPEAGLLYGPKSRVVWHRTMTAMCLLEDHFAPHERCECGLYAAPTLAELILDNDPDVVIGAVEGWGTCHITDRYWKAEHARIVFTFPYNYVL